MPHTEEIEAYFIRLAKLGQGLLNAAPIEREPQPLEYALERLAPHLEKIRSQELEKLIRLNRPVPHADRKNCRGVGLNSIGMLADRFTILVIKAWCIANKGKRDYSKAQALYDSQTLDIIAAMAAARPGSSAMNTKITSIVSDASNCATWEEAFFGLFATNLIIWESQEMLYVKNIAEVECGELRAYIKWFSMSNIRRNSYIESCERTYWSHSVSKQETS
jgi:hypothetical protein